MNSSKIKQSLKILVSVLLLTYLLYLIDIQEVLILFRDLALGWFLLATFVLLMDQVFLGLKWNILLRALHISVSSLVTVIAYIRGRAFIFFIPSTLGVDAYKIYYLKKYSNNTKGIVSSVVIERFFGALSTLLIVAFLFYFFSRRLDAFAVSDSVLAIISGALIIVAILVLHLMVSNISWLYHTSFWGILPTKMRARLQPVFDNLLLLEGKAASLYAYIGCSVLEKLVYGLIIYCSAQALNLDNSDFFYIIAATPILSLLERLPISVAAIGLKEGLMVAMFVPLGVAAPEALAIALVVRAVSISQVLLFSFIWWIDHDSMPSVEELKS